jgi:regulator of cell morphogenesis and NO signaling
MFLSSLEINSKSRVSDIAALDHRAADVFKKYEIEYCCGGKWPLETVCLMKGIDISELQKELKMATRNLQLPSSLSFHDWSMDFLTDYIVNVHHYYLKKTLPELKPLLDDFVEEHSNKYPELSQLSSVYAKLYKDIIPHIQEEEELIFPYIKQVAHAYENKDSYAALLVKTLRKPIDKLMRQEHEIVNNIIFLLRDLTQNYTAPEKACTSHRVIYSKLKELDNDLLQHIYLENNILFPKAIDMEKELLERSI